MAKLHFGILDRQRRDLLPLLAPLKDRFYLAGGTALALQKGHRDSVDFDFFSQESFDTGRLQEDISRLLKDKGVTVTQAAPDTLGVLAGDSIRLSFFAYKYPLVEPLRDAGDVKLASPTDIGCMKLSAITSRSALKDYVDIYTILQNVSLAQLLQAAKRKFPQLDENVILKALVYFDDVEDEPIAFQPGFEVSQAALESFLRAKVREIS